VDSVPVTARNGAVTQQYWLNTWNSSYRRTAITTAILLAHDRNVLKINIMETLFQK